MRGEPLLLAAMEHHVYFWMKEERKGGGDLAEFEAGLAKLCQSPNIARAKWGQPAATEERPVTDHSWDYGLSLAFDSLEAHNRYQSEADTHHMEFVGTFKEWWDKVLVMDLD